MLFRKHYRDSASLTWNGHRHMPVCHCHRRIHSQFVCMTFCCSIADLCVRCRTIQINNTIHAPRDADQCRWPGRWPVTRNPVALLSAPVEHWTYIDREAHVCEIFRGFGPRWQVRALQLAPDWDGVRSVAEAVLMPGDVSERGRPCPAMWTREIFYLKSVITRNCAVGWWRTGSSQAMLSAGSDLRNLPNQRFELN